MTTPIADAAASRSGARPAPLLHRPGARGSGKTEPSCAATARSSRPCRSPRRSSPSPSPSRRRPRCGRGFLKNLPNAGEIGHRLRIQTIDAFAPRSRARCWSLLRFGAQPGIVEDATEHYRAAAQRTIDELTRRLSPAPAPRQQHEHRGLAHRRDAREARPMAAQNRPCPHSLRARSQPSARARAHPRARAHSPPEGFRRIRRRRAHAELHVAPARQPGACFSTK